LAVFGKRILLLEDDRNVADLLMHVLHAGGYVVDVVRTVAEAKRSLDEDDYQLLIADWRLPDGDGTAVADDAASRGVKTALLTGYAFQMPPEKAARYEVWMKPMRPSELLTAVERCIREPCTH
jgi:two-component system, NtrC family, response regulator HydG